MVHAAPARQTEAMKAKAPAPRLRVNKPNDSYEQEADRVADAVLSDKSPQWSLAAIGVGGVGVQRKCTCGDGEDECEQCKTGTVIQRKATHGAAYAGAPAAVPGSVPAVLGSPGRPLERSTRAFFEPRFGHDFSRIRIHTDAQAAVSARAIHAHAYTAGHHIAFAAGEYSPGTERGKRLLAHELTHVLQQQGSTGPGPMIQRDTDKHAPPVTTPAPAKTPCSTDGECAKAIPGSSWDFAHLVAQKQAENKKNTELMQENEKKTAEKKKQPATDETAKTKDKPADSGKTGDKKKGAPTGHVEVIFGDVTPVDVEPAGPALAFKQTINDEDKTILTNIWDVIIDPSIGEAAGGQMTNCELADPKPDPQDNPDARCINIPRTLEQQSLQFQQGAKKIGGLSRGDWLTNAVSTATHEKAHMLFNRNPPVGAAPTLDKTPQVFNYSPQIFQFDLGEMNSILSEFQVHFDRTPEKERDTKVRKFLVDYINNPQEGLRGIIKKLHCVAPCADVDAAIKQVVSARIFSKAQAAFFQKIVTDPALKLGWPK